MVYRHPHLLRGHRSASTTTLFIVVRKDHCAAVCVPRMFSNITGALTPPPRHSCRSARRCAATYGAQPAELRIIDDWRRRQPDLPARAEAIRRA
jgi:hypothetical protein